jgi:hypothetical protein
MSEHHGRLPRHRGGRLATGVAAGLAAIALGGSAPASAQMLGTTMSQLAGPFAGRMGPGAMPPYGSQAGAYAHLMQGTQVAMPAMTNIVGDLNQPSMAHSSQVAAQGESRGGGEKPDVPDSGSSESYWELVVGACAGGAFIGAFSALNAAAPIAAAGAAAPPAAGLAVATAMGTGCVLGAATASVSLGAIWLFKKAT